MIDAIVDTSVLVDVLRGSDTPQSVRMRELILTSSVGITDIVYGEVRVGHASRSTDAFMRRFLDEGRVVGVESHEDLELAIDCCRRSERIGRPVRSITDCLVAAVCIREGLPLLHDDRDFDVLASCTDLQVVPA